METPAYPLYHQKKNPVCGVRAGKIGLRLRLLFSFSRSHSPKNNGVVWDGSSWAGSPFGGFPKVACYWTHSPSLSHKRIMTWFILPDTVDVSWNVSYNETRNSKVIALQSTVDIYSMCKEDELYSWIFIFLFNFLDQGDSGESCTRPPWECEHATYRGTFGTKPIPNHWSINPP